MHGLILAAGFGTRMGFDLPKALIPWGEGTVVDHQLDNLDAVGVEEVTVVTGFMADKLEAHIKEGWEAKFVRNDAFMDTNTARSMLLGMRAIEDGPVVAMNGDVLFDAPILDRLEGNGSAVAVIPGVCGAEEIKYHVVEGRLVALSKEVHGQGEAVGVNLWAGQDRDLLQKALAYVDDQAYFERAVEHMLPYTDSPVRAVDVGDFRAIELDFPEDLEEAKRLFGDV